MVQARSILVSHSTVHITWLIHLRIFTSKYLPQHDPHVLLTVTQMNVLESRWQLIVLHASSRVFKIYQRSLSRPTTRDQQEHTR